MPPQWLSKSSDLRGRANAALEGSLRSLAQPARARRLRRLALLLMALWAVLALAQLIWALLPAPPATLPEEAAIVNPLTQPSAPAEAEPVDVARMAGWHLFGEAGAAPEAASQPEVAVSDHGATAREGIEEGARETRLDLRLVGAVASTDDGLGFAIIEYKKEQDVYAVEDKLPVPGQVVLAKVMSRQVVLDNGGTYELLRLFEESELDAQLGALPPAAGPGARRGPAAGEAAGAVVKTVDKRADADATALAQRYRDQLYRDPQSLAEVVSVTAVREAGELLGYRIGPGPDRKQFERLGFEPGDLVTSVNGIALNDPANTVRLYQTMRSATEAVFELERREQQLQVSVSLADAGAQP